MRARSNCGSAPRRRIAWKLAFAASAVVAGALADAQGQIIRQSFTATAKPVVDENFNVVEPPDTMGAVGLNHFAQFLNGTFSVYYKSNHAEVMNISDADFWSNAGVTIPGDGISDPRIVFDPNTRRWFATQIDFTADPDTGEVQPDNNILLAVSQTSNPAGAWTGLPTISCDPGHTLFGDFPRLGFDANGVYIVTDNYQVSPETLQKINIVSIPKADLVAATPTLSRMTQFAMESPSSRGYSPQPVLDQSPTSAHGVILAIDNENFGQLNRTTINNSGAAGATLSPSVDIFVAQTAQPPAAQQLDSSTLIETNDDRISAQVVKVGGSLWAVQETGYPIGSRTPRSALRWYQINESTNALVQPEGTVYDPNFDFYMPSIAANQFGDVVLGFTRSGASEYAGAFAMVGATNPVTHVTTFSSPILLQEGQAPYEAEAFGIANRWGDYSATTVDPADPFIFWTIQEYAEEDNVFGYAAWGTHVDEIIIPHPNEERWSGPGDGTFSTGSNWLTGASAASTDHAIFSVATAPSPTGYTVTFDGSITNTRASVRQGKVTFNLSGHTYTLGGSDPANPSLSVGEFGGEPELTIQGGTLTSVNAALSASPTASSLVTLASGTTWNNSGSLYVGGGSSVGGGDATLAVQSAATLTVGSNLRIWSRGTYTHAGTMTAGSITSDGVIAQSGGTISTGPIAGQGSLNVSAGQLTSDGIRQKLVNLTATGAVRVRANGGNAGVSYLATLSISGAAKLDLNDNDLIVEYGTNPNAFLTIRGYVFAGYSSAPDPSKTGIVSTTGQSAGNTILALLDNSLLGATDWPLGSGNTISANSVIGKYTYFGDVNFDGQVTPDDYGILDANIGTTPPLGVAWINGDANLDGKVTPDDYAILDANFGSGVGHPLGALHVSAVPEPGMIGFVALAGFCPRRKRFQQTQVKG